MRAAGQEQETELSGEPALCLPARAALLFQSSWATHAQVASQYRPAVTPRNNNNNINKNRLWLEGEDSFTAACWGTSDHREQESY